MIFDYPIERISRRHGPSGYADYESYRPWLRDEFWFRCVYCLKRQTWGQVSGDFELDHFQPQSIEPQLSVDYLNLVYSCRRCNATKGAQAIQDPMRILTSDRLNVLPDGNIESTQASARRLIRQLDLNAPKLIQWRLMWMRIVDLAREKDPQLFYRLTGFPEDLPDLAALRPTSNSVPEGIHDSCLSLRERGKLPLEY